MDQDQNKKQDNQTDPIIPPVAPAMPVTPAQPQPNLDNLMNTVASSWVPGADGANSPPPPLGGSSMPPTTPPMSTGDISTGAPKPKFDRRVLLAGLLLLLLTFPVVIYYTSQRAQIADTRNRAAEGVYPYCGDGICQDTVNGCNTCPQDCNGPLSCSGQCAGVLESCESTPCCDGQGTFCTGNSGDRKCNIPEVDPVTACEEGGGTCTGLLAFKCSQLTNDQCKENEQSFSLDNWENANEYAMPCGQVDTVCIGGTQNRQLCGDFVINTQCSTSTPNNTASPTNPPGNTSTPTNTPSATPTGGQCDNIKIYVDGQEVDPSTLEPGQTVQIAVAGTNATAARISINGATPIESTTLNNSGEFVFDYTFAGGTINFVIDAEVLINGIWR